MPMIEEMVIIPGAKPLPAFLTRLTADIRRPAVILIPEIFGLNENIRDTARRIAEAGYAALAPDFFRHEPTPYDQFSTARQVASSLTDAQALVDIDNALSFLNSQPFVQPRSTGIFGFCMGGRLAFLASCMHADRIRACVDFYGARKSGGSVHPGQTMIPLAEAASLQAPVLMFYGEKDSFISKEEIEKVRRRLTELSKRFEIHVYPGADHGFFCDARGSYAPEAASDAWSRTLRFLADHLGER